jgi:signal transduction histidine kinase
MSGAARRRFRPPAWLQPADWGVSVKSAIVSASVVLIAVLITGAGLVAVLYASLLTSVDDAAARRVGDVVAALDFDTAAELDNALLMTDQRVFSVQVIGADGTVLRRSESAPDHPVPPVSEFGDTMRSGLSDDLSPKDDMRMAGRTADTATGRYTVIVGAGSESAERTAGIVAVLLALAAPIIAAVAAFVSYRLVKRSLRSVDAIRSRVAEISASDLSERVPVPRPRDEISALAATMNAMLARVESGHTAQRRFVGDASHELRSPLASIISALEVAQDYPEILDDDLRNGTLIPEAYRMQTLVEDLLLLARADERGIAKREEEIHLDVLAESEAMRLRRETDLDVRLDTEPTAVVVGDLSGIGRMLRNLIDNAVRHATSTIALDVRVRSGAAVVTVSDDGPGVPEAERERVFERFVRLDSARSRDGGGSGLGLAIVAEIVAGHGGTVRIDGRAGGGTVVTVTLPVQHADAPPVSTDHQPA